MKYLSLILTSFLVSSTALVQTAHSEGLIEVKEVRYLMGTRASIVLYHADKSAGKRIIRKAFEVAEKFDRLLSNYKPTSELSRLNADLEKKEVTVSSELYSFLETSQKLHQKTDGAFDITTHRLLDLWRISHQKGKYPSRDSLAAALQATGSQHFSLLPQNVVLFDDPTLQFNSGGIGKGYAVDKMIGYLRSQDIKHALINIGESSIAAIGAPPGLGYWKVLFSFPGEDPLGVVQINNMSLSASDSHAQKLTVEGKTYGHIVDPKTGLPGRKRIQAAVVTKNAAEAEAFTKFLVLRDAATLLRKSRPAKVEVYTKEAGVVYMSEDFPLSNEKG